MITPTKVLGKFRPSRALMIIMTSFLFVTACSHQAHQKRGDGSIESQVSSAQVEFSKKILTTYIAFLNNASTELGKQHKRARQENLLIATQNTLVFLLNQTTTSQVARDPKWCDFIIKAEVAPAVVEASWDMIGRRPICGHPPKYSCSDAYLDQVETCTGAHDADDCPNGLVDYDNFMANCDTSFTVGSNQTEDCPLSPIELQLESWKKSCR